MKLSLKYFVPLACMASSAFAGDFKVIANSSVQATDISVAELKSVFLITKGSLHDGSHVVPVVLKGGPAHESMLKECLGKNANGLETYYRGLVFTGTAPMPKMVATDAEMKAYVARTKGAIGYVSADTDDQGVKTLELK